MYLVHKCLYQFFLIKTDIFMGEEASRCFQSYFSKIYLFYLISKTSDENLFAYRD